MDTETKHYLNECARLGAMARERKASADAQARAASITIEQLRARVAKLEEALRATLYALQSECATRGDAWIARASGDDWTDEINAASAALDRK